MINLDYETRSKADLKRVGQWRYALDPSTEILCFAYSIDGGQVKSWRIGQRLPKDFCAAITRGDTVHAFNANFEKCITETNKIGIPQVSKWRDTQAVALMCSLPASLGQLAKVLGTDDLKDTEGKRLIRKFCSPQKDGTFTDPSGDDFDLLVKYCEQDVRTEMAVAKALPISELPPLEQRVWALDSQINKRGIPMDIPLIKGAVAIERRAQKEAKASLTRLTGGKINSPGEVARMIALAAELDYPLDNVQVATIVKVLKDTSAPLLLRQVLRVRQQCAQAAVKKYAAALNAICPDGTVKSIHRYHGAHTGRWTATLLQTQNLARPRLKLDERDNAFIRAGDYDALEILYNDPMAVLRDAVRHMIKGPLVACDLAGIEARVVGWLADDQRYQTAFRTGLDLYKVTAAEIFGTPYANVSDDQRWVGKQAVLGLSYCIAKGTPIATRTGFKPIETITKDDELWNGRKWVKGGGAKLTGRWETCINLGKQNTWLTPQHRVLWDGNWVKAEDVLADEKYQNWVNGLDGGLSLDMTSLEHAYTQDVTAPAHHTSASVDSPDIKLLSVARARSHGVARREGSPQSTDISCKTIVCEVCGGYGTSTQRDDVTTRTTKTIPGMVGEGSNSVSPSQNSCCTLRRYPDGKNSIFISIGSTTMATMTTGTCDSSAPRQTHVISEVYDIIDVEDGNRFQAGDLIVHNCMGNNTFYDQCKKSKPDIDRGLINRAVAAYRKTYHKIVAYWSTIEHAAVAAVQRPSSAPSAGAVSFKMVGSYLTMRLPSGRSLWYPNARIQMVKTSWGEDKPALTYTIFKNGHPIPSSTYGGRLTENAVQAIARDVMADWMLKINKITNIRLHIHDEVVCTGDASVDDIIKQLSPPPWAPGMILGAAGFSSPFYRK